MDPKDKELFRQRVLRGFDRHTGYEERKEQKRRSAERRAKKEPRPPRKRGWSAEHDEAEDVSPRPARRAARREAARAEPAGDAALADERGLVLSVARGRVRVRTESGERWAVLGRGVGATGEGGVVVGDDVALALPEDGEPRVVAVAERRTRLSRPDPGNANRELCLAANVDVAVLVLSVGAPPLRAALADRFLVAVADGGVEPVVCVNKLDLLADEGERRALEALQGTLAELGVVFVGVSAETRVGVAELRAAVEGRTCVFTGHSGVGKSSLLNALDPGAGLRTGGVRADDGRGRHTTTSSTLRELDGGTRVIDTPGVRAFGLWGLDAAAVRRGFPDFDQAARGCRYADCTHRVEPACGVRAAVEAGEVRRARYAVYLRLLEEVG